MEKFYLRKNDRKTVERAMPASERKLYKSGNYAVYAEIYRRKPLKKYGDHVNIMVEKNGKVVFCSLDPEYSNAEILSYFLYGDSGDFRIAF